ncbi:MULTISPECIES: site-specific integrase [Bacillus cereus group]|uniref:site-specific integrase n=1 Tax=Bacillus cereus group TaxID=86661 RepID=UPI001F58D7B9|nr:site-specific integrase [Bacillus cereus group sp. BfR-BA-01522]
MSGSIKQNKQTGKWDFIFNIAKDPMTGKRRQVRRRGFSSKREAEEEMVKLKAEVLNNEFISTSKMTYRTYMNQWFKEREFSIQESTYEMNLGYYKNIIQPRLGHLDLQQMTPVLLQNFVSNLVSEKRYSSYTIHLIFRIVSVSLKKAKILKLIKEDPTVGITLPKLPKKEIKVWTIEEVNFFLQESKKLDALTRHFIAFSIAIQTGMRQGEILGLRWQDIDFENGIIYVRQTITRAAKVKSGAKNASSIRSIHIPTGLIEELKERKQRIDLERLLAGDKYQDFDLVVCTQEGKPILPRNLRVAFHSLSDKLGLPYIRFHDLRHTHATILIQRNVNVKLIADRLGHTDIQTTLNTYSHVIPDMQKSVAEEIAKVIVG